MTPDPRCPSGFCPFKGFNPEGDGELDFLVAKDQILGHFRSTSNRNKQLEGFMVGEVIRRPTAVFADLKSPTKSGWWCYVGKPTGRFLNDRTIQIPIRNGLVFAVYIRSRRAAHGQLVVDSWECLP